MKIHFIILLIVLTLNIIPQRFINRKKIILPISFLIIGVYLAIRYNYGLDYFNYMNSFYSGMEVKNRGTGEFLFYRLMHLFSKYYVFIIFHSLVLISVLFIYTRKYNKPNNYILFFFLFLCMSGMFFNMISALRSTMAACVFFIGLELFYLRKKNIIFYSISVIIASLFHTSVIVFIILPFIELIYRNINYKLIFFLLFVSLIFGMFLSKYFYNFVFSNVNLFDSYLAYLDKHTTNDATLNATLFKSLYLFPAYYILKYLKNIKGVYYYIGMLATIFFFIFFLNLNFESRFTSYLFIFVIFSLSMILSLNIDTKSKLFILIPIIIATLVDFYIMYYSMYLHIFGRYSEGNYLWYQTIFSIPQLP